MLFEVILIETHAVILLVFERSIEKLYVFICI